MPLEKATLEESRLLAGRYEFVERLGHGGMSEVFLGRQIGLDRPVAIKVVHTDAGRAPRVIARFRQEAQICKKLTHPNTVRIYDFGETDQGDVFLVMEYLTGRTFDKILAVQQKLSLDTIAHVARQVLKSLIEAHAYGIVHRDIKPSNLMACSQIGEDNLVKVLDFGIARVTETDAAYLTDSGMIVGTPHYVSPEQALGQAIDARSDLYSLGITLLELATGHPPYQGGSPVQVAMKHASPDPIEIPDWLASTPLGQVIRRAVAKSPEGRYPSAQAMLTDLTQRCGGDRPNGEAVGEEPAQPPWVPDDAEGERSSGISAYLRRITRHRRIAWIVSIALLVGGLVAALAIKTRKEPHQPPPEDIRSTMGGSDSTDEQSRDSLDHSGQEGTYPVAEEGTDELVDIDLDTAQETLLGAQPPIEEEGADEAVDVDLDAAQETLLGAQPPIEEIGTGRESRSEPPPDRLAPVRTVTVERNQQADTQDETADAAETDVQTPRAASETAVAPSAAEKPMPETPEEEQDNRVIRPPIAPVNF